MVKKNKDQSAISDKCYKLLYKIPKGKVTTYKLLADALGTKGYRAIGQILKRNPNPISCPCHRVISSDGKIGGFAFGSAKKIELLEGEGVKISNNKTIDLKDFLFKL